MKFISFIVFALYTPLCVLAARHALLVGNSDGGREYAHLHYVRKDISALQSVLTKYCGFGRDNIHTSVNRGPEELEKKLLEIKLGLQQDTSATVFLFYYSGHAEHGRFLMGDKSYSLDNFRKHFDSLDSGIRIAVFDACNSGSFTRAKGGKLAEPFLVRDEPSVEGNVILYSSSAHEHSQESDIYANSVFTFHFVNALRGFGDISGDGKVTLDEAYKYSFDRTVASTAHTNGGVQHPGYKFDIRGEGGIVLADLTVRTSAMILERAVTGNITVLDRQQTLVAEIEKKTGSRALIALSPGVYTVFNHCGDSVKKTRVRIDKKEVSSVGSDDFAGCKGFSARPKGIAANHWSLNIKTNVGYRFLGLQKVELAVNEYMEGYRCMGLQPRLWLPDGSVKGGLEIRLVSKNGMLWFAGFDYLRFGRKRNFRGARQNRFDGEKYGSRLCLSDTMKIFSLSTGTGYRLQSSLLKNLYVSAGLDFTVTRFKAGSELSDSLFNIEPKTSITRKGFKILPHIGIGYTYRLWRALSIGADIRYRYQRRPEKLNPVSEHITYMPEPVPENGLESDMPGLKFDIGGFDVSLSVVWQVRFPK